MISVRTPFRLPLGGGGTDLPAYYSKYGGTLVTAAINKYMFINVNISALVDKIRIAYSKTEIVENNNIEEIKHDIVRETLKYFKHYQRIDISSMADLPAGTGMGSSSSFTVGMINAINYLKNLNLTKKELAELACEIEINKCHKPIGKQDQYAATYGGIIKLNINSSGNVTVHKLKLDPETIHEMEYRLMLFYTNKQRDANDILKEQSENARQNRANTISSMHKIKEIGEKIYLSLEHGDIDNIGKLMNEHWNVKKNISNKMSNKYIDDIYDLALNNGALGGKIMGAGGGGLFVFCVQEGKRKLLRNNLENYGLKFLDFRFDWEGSKLISNF